MDDYLFSLIMKTRSDANILIERHTNPSKLGAALTLYDVLSSCLLICEKCLYDETEYRKIETLFQEQEKTGNRRYIEKGSDIYVLVCRYIFTNTDRTNAMRYASTLREAAKRQISSEQLVSYMKNNGGINALYFSRPLSERSVKTKTLRLADQIQFSRDKPFRLTLEWKDDNTFKVLFQEEVDM